MKLARLVLGFLAAAALAGCASTPPTNVHQPMTMRPPPRPDAAANNGSIYNAAVSRPLFEDRRARFVGDTLTISIVENTQAKTASDSNASKTGSINAGVTSMVGVPGKTLQGLSIDETSSNTFKGAGGSNASNVFTGNITVTVIEVLPNGNLLVSGEKQLAIGQGQEFIRLSGVVNPYQISTANVVQSSQVADARIEYKSSGYINEAQVMGWLARFFLNVLPF